MVLICWHSNSFLGLCIVLMVSEHGPLPGALLNTVVSNGSEKPYSLEQVGMMLTLQI
jgi:hypothetical protein